MKNVLGTDNEYLAAFKTQVPAEKEAILKKIRKPLGNSESNRKSESAVLEGSDENKKFDEDDALLSYLVRMILSEILENKSLCGKSEIIYNQDAWLFNGARYYNDHWHPEYCTPECTSIRELLIHNLAGDRIVEAARKEIETKLGTRVLLIKNNSDGKKTSFGSHENYHISPNLFRSLVYKREGERRGKWLAFLISRQIIAGAGKMGCEAKNENPAKYEIAQRSDFVETISSIETMHARPIINTRNETLADKENFSRLHVIIGDGNMSHWSCYLKFGTAYIVLQMLEEGFIKETFVFEDVVGAVHKISCDLSGRKKIIKLAGGKSVSAVDLQRFFCNKAAEFVNQFEPGQKEEMKDIVEKWDFILRMFEEKKNQDLRPYLDWVQKYMILDKEMRIKKSYAWGHKRMRAADLQYHYLDKEKGLYFLYKNDPRFKMEELVSEKEIQDAITNPPLSRAVLRSMLLKRANGMLARADWDSISIFFKKNKNERGIMIENGLQMGDPTYPCTEEEKKQAEIMVEELFGKNSQK